MHSLFLRIFVLFLAAMAIIVGGSIATVFTIAAREYESPEFARRPNVAIQASQVLASGGIVALQRWLDDNKNALPDRELFIVGPDGKDILGRHLTDQALRRLQFFNREPNYGEPPSFEPPPPGNFRAARASPQIVAADGTTYTVLVLPRRPSVFGALTLPGISLTILCIALLVSALTSWWLARHLSAPIKRIQAGARALASEQLNVRVSAGLEDRKDELAVLARDFDAMADQLRTNRGLLNQLLRDISHELRSPLARMRVAVGLARQPARDLPRQIDRLEHEIERLDALISQVLKLARLHDSPTSMEREAVDLDEVLERVVHDANFEGAIKQCSVALHGRAGISVLGNRELLQSAIENVLRNAVRYSPPGTTVDVSLARGAAELGIVVRDHGPGVPAGELQRIFEPFYRVAESRDRDSGGEGIGLAITSRVMKTHGGGAEARNQEGGGLEVRLRLPIGAAAAA